jgi:hypothetical protein
MSAKNPLIYYTIYLPPTFHPKVRATYRDGTTRTWTPEDRGYKAAKARAARANNSINYGKGR